MKATPQERNALTFLAHNGTAWPVDEASVDVLESLVALGMACRTSRAAGTVDYRPTRAGLEEIGLTIQ